MESRIAAREQADAILLNYADMPKADAARIRTILTEVILFESPIRQMDISITDTGATEYIIIILGYRNTIDDLRWVNTFFGASRHDDLTAIKESQTLFSDNAKILKVEKLHFVNSDTATKKSQPRRRPFERRTD